MMPSPDVERFAVLIADNAVFAFERARDGASFHPTMRTTAVSVLVRSLLSVLLTTDGAVLAAACNRGLDDVMAPLGLVGPVVDEVDPDDGSVTMRAGV